MSLLFVIDAYNITNHRLFNQRPARSKSPCFGLTQFIKTNRLLGSAKNKAILVFDGFPLKDDRQDQDSQFEVVYSGESSADEKIMKIIEGAKNKPNLVVVSDDKEIIYFARVYAVKTQAVAEFIGYDEAENKKAMIKKKQEDDDKLNYSQTHKINEELKKIWLK